ncbi:cilia- and flagella-associated protein 45-like isoform X2 [Halichondria panicea]|uniref:cilia- and flagella-associated protein 45-like isoform X2 n=1 Tax=Halichondria panicea TaxID=6063 RepID=UPI00312B90BB
MATVIKMATKSRFDKLQDRYDLLTSKAAAGESFLPNTSYANFLKSHDYQSLPNVVPDATLFTPKPPARVSKLRPLSANTIRKRAEASLDDSKKRLQAIEDHMWGHRQEERELKRAEMEVGKQKKQLQRVMKNYESSMTQKKVSDGRGLQDKEAKFTQYLQRDVHQAQEAGRERAQVALAGRQRLNEATKKYVRSENEMGWRYRNLVQVLDRKRSEVEQLSHDFESKLRAKEEEQFKLKQELAQLAISLNMEAHMYRAAVAEGHKESEKEAKKEIQDTYLREESLSKEERSKVSAAKHYENTKRVLNQSLMSKQETHAARERQGGRQLLDVRSKLQRNTENKMFTSLEAEQVQLDILGQQNKTKLEIAEARRRVKAEVTQDKRRDKNEKELSEWTARSALRENEVRRRQYEQRLKKLSTLVSQHDTQEQELYSQAKSAEAERKKQSQVVEVMHQELESLKQANARRLKELAVQAQKAESELHQKILRENAELAKNANIREERLQHLTMHRLRTKEDHHLYKEVKKERDRRTRIKNRTTLQSV